MRGARFGVLLVALFGLATASAEPFEDYSELPQFQSFDLSPTGKRMLALRPTGETHHLVVTDFEKRTSKLILAADHDNWLFNYCRWVSEERIVCSIRSYSTLISAAGGRYIDGRITMTRLLAVDHDGGNYLQLVPDNAYRVRRDLKWNDPIRDRVINWMPDDPDRILIALNRDDRTYPSVFKLNVNNNRLSRVRKSRPPITQWYADNTGVLHLATGYRSGAAQVFKVDGRNVTEVENIPHSAQAPPNPLGFSNDGRFLYLAANFGNPTVGIYKMDLTDQSTTLVFSDPEVDIPRGLFLDRNTGEPFALRYLKDAPTWHWFEQAGREMYQKLQKTLTGEHVDIVANNDDRSRFVIENSGGIVPTYYLFDSSSNQLRSLGTQYPQLATDEVATVKSIRYPVRDGYSVPGYLTTPPKGSQQNLPTIILPHGGPWARDFQRFDYWAQYFAARGYAVLQPNFRGSYGYGIEHLEAGFNQWGLRMQDDVMDGLAWMIKTGVTDPKRVCIVGGSYGGYVALVAAFRDPGAFRCAVSFAGVTDLSDLRQSVRRYQLGELTLARIQDDASARAHSPLNRVADIDLPLLIVHGDLDRSVMVDQSRTFTKALAEAGKDFRYIEQAGGDHFLSIHKHRRQFLRAIDEFLTEHLDDR